MKKYSKEIQDLLKSVVDECDGEDRTVREAQIRSWRRYKLLWDGFSRVWYSETAHDWRIHTETEGTDQGAYDQPINVFRAYLESIIAALSITVPPIKCFPDDADNTLDLATAKAGDKIAQLIYRHNDVTLLWLHALFIYCTEGMTACYVYSKSDEKYGTYEEPEYKEDYEDRDVIKCSNCGELISEDDFIPPVPSEIPVESGMNEMGLVPPIPPMNPFQMEPSIQEEIPVENELIELDKTDEFDPGPELCPNCQQLIQPTVTKETFIVTRLVGKTKLPKSRVCMEAYGGLHVKIPNYARKQENCPYLQFSQEINYVDAVEKHEGLDFDKLQNGSGAGNEENQGRLSPQYSGEYPENVVTEKVTWLRPCSFNFLNEDDRKKLKREFPKGCKVTFINELYAAAESESLDDHWTLTYNPLADHLHFDPLGSLLTSVQEITNDLNSLTLQTIEHGIGQTFADPAVLGFKAYGETEVVPGGIFPAVPKSGKSLSDGFHELRTATLSPEVMPFANQIQSMAQLVSGALPSLFGGTMAGSETASQYSMSRAQALQRLQNTWKIYTSWWKNIFSKAVPLYIKNVKDDERNVEQDDEGNFINTFIRKSELEGKIGRIELEAADNLPLTWAQINDIIMKLLENGNPEIVKIISSPENIPLIHAALGLTDFYVPGEDDVIKQNDEIKELLNSEPIPLPTNEDMIMQAELMGEPPPPEEEASIQIDLIYDNHQIEFETIRKWAVSEAGRQAKIDNPNGHRNVLLHGKLHYDQMQLLMQQQAEAAAIQESPEKSNPLKTKEAPIQGEGDVSVTH